jgi:hypothetical protein
MAASLAHRVQISSPEAAIELLDLNLTAAGARSPGIFFEGPKEIKRRDEMFKKIAVILALVAGFAIADTPQAEAWPYRRVAPVRRVLAPPYPVARAAVVGPRYYARPYYARPYVATPYVTGYRGYGYGYGGPGVYIGF